jgi:Xaa-Pro dipeptidase
VKLEFAMRQHRLAALRANMAALRLDAVAIVPGANFHYLTGGRFSSMERPTILVIPAEGEVRAILPALELLSFERLEVEARVHAWRDSDGYADACAAAMAGLRPRRLGVEGQRMRVFEEIALRAALPEAEIVDAQQAIARMRLRKDAGEIAMLRQAIAISEKALAATLAVARVGLTERELESRLIRELFAAGAESLAFPPIVVAGAQSAEGHGHAGDYEIRPGDTLLFDFGAAVGGYNADVTRTVFVGEPAAEARALYETVYEANRIGRAFARPNITAGAVDDAVQSFLEKSPFVEGDLIKTGHGLGLDVHEAPQIMRGNDMVLEPGMVFTIEPGLYLSGRRGVRIEDDVVVTETGIESLTTFPRELRVVG